MKKLQELVIGKSSLEKKKSYDSSKDFNLIIEAMNGARGKDQRRIAETVIKWGALLLRKNKDYGSSVWRPPILSPAADIGEAIFVRMSDQVERIASLRKKGDNEVKDESLDDTLADLASYALLYLARPK